MNPLSRPLQAAYFRRVPADIAAVDGISWADIVDLFMDMRGTAVILICSLFCACAPARRTAPVKNAEHPRLSPEQVREVDRLYYEAVGAYSTNELDSSLAYLKKIFRIDPDYRPARELLEKIRLASGS